MGGAPPCGPRLETTATSAKELFISEKHGGKKPRCGNILEKLQIPLPDGRPLMIAVREKLIEIS